MKKFENTYITLFPLLLGKKNKTTLTTPLLLSGMHAVPRLSPLCSYFSELHKPGSDSSAPSFGPEVAVKRNRDGRAGRGRGRERGRERGRGLGYGRGRGREIGIGSGLGFGSG